MNDKDLRENNPAYDMFIGEPEKKKVSGASVAVIIMICLVALSAIALSILLFRNNTNLHSEIIALEDRNIDLSGQARALEISNADLSEQARSLKEENARLTERNTELQSEVESYNGYVAPEVYQQEVQKAVEEAVQKQREEDEAKAGVTNAENEGQDEETFAAEDNGNGEETVETENSGSDTSLNAGNGVITKEALADADANQMRNYIENTLTSGKSGPAGVIRDIFPNHLIITREGKYIFYRINNSVARHGFSDEDFEIENGRMVYKGSDSGVSGTLGIDVSYHQGNIDWAKVKADGVDFAMIRAGFRTGGSGTIDLDDTFEANVQGASANGIKVGIYWYTTALNEDEAAEEAAFLINALEPYRSQITLPVALDMELADSADNRMANVTKEQFTRNAVTFLNMIRNAGYTPMVYGNVTSFVLMVDDLEMSQYENWIAWYDTPQYYPYKFRFWQYTSEGRVDGINGNVDLNISVSD